MEHLELSFKKLKEEDRRFLINRNINILSANVQGANHNSSLAVSVLAIIIAGYSLILQTQIINYILIYAILSTIGLIILTQAYKGAKKNLYIENKQLKINHDDLLKKHLEYALQEK